MYTYDINAPAGNLHSSGKDRIYPDPFLSYSTMLMPKTIDETLRWCEHLWLRNGTYAQAMKRVVAYFLTKVEIIGAADQEKARFEELLNETMKVDVQLFYLGMDYMAYGNSFSSLIVPFKRMLRNPKTRTEIPIDRVDYEFKGGKFHWTDPKTNEAVVSEKPIDRRITTESEVGIKRWSPHQIKIQYHPVSGRKVYLWQPPADIIKKVKQGDKFILRDMPWEMVQAILDDKLFEFNPDIIYHMCEDALAGIDTAGWGISHMIPNFMQAYYIQMAKLYNEVLMNEYILPFRAVTPAKGNQGKTDPLISGNMGSFNSKILGMLKQHRRNPGGWHALPFPIEYQSLGGEGAQINTYDHIGAAMDELLNASGVPAEFYKGTISFQALPSALRLFQNSWPHLVSHFNGWLDWLMKQLAIVFNWDKATAKLQPVTLADDIEKRSIMLQLMSGQMVSKETALAPMGIDAGEELRRIMDERSEQMQEEERFQREQQQKQLLQSQFEAPMQGAAMPGGGMAAGAGMPGGQAPTITPNDMMIQAEQEAQRLLAMDYSQRRSEMHKLKKANEQLHALVKSKIEEIRGSAQQQGGQMLLQDMAAQQGPAV